MPSPRYWREIPSRYRLEAGRCRGCGKVAYPARKVCPACRGRAFDRITLSRRGKVVTSTRVHVAPSDLIMEAPYTVAVIETPEGARLSAQVVDCDGGGTTVAPGLDVTLEFRLVRREGREGILCYGYKGVPATQARAGQETMPRIHLWPEVSPELLQRYEEQAARQGEVVEHLLEQTVKVLLREMEEEEQRTPEPALTMS